MSLAGDKCRIALAQLGACLDKTTNILSACKAVKRATEQGADMVILPECFNSPYGTKHFAEYAEKIPDGPTFQALSKVSKECGVWLIGGSIPEEDSGRLYNTCMVFNREGLLVDKYRKMHLFDINIPGRVKFCESASLSAGDRPVVFKTEFGKVGLGICYDLRFPELAVNAAQAGCFMIVYPGAFTETTGPLHWELLLRSRAVDNQMFVAGVSGSLDTSIPDGYRAWGHSMMVNPMGVVIAKAERTEAILMVDLCLAEVEETRNSIPITRQKRLDLYSQAAFFNN